MGLTEGKFSMALSNLNPDNFFVIRWLVLRVYVKIQGEVKYVLFSPIF